MTILVPSGARGVQLKSNVPLRCSSAESLGFSQNVQSKFSVVMACGKRRSHKCIGKFLLVVHRQATK